MRVTMLVRCLAMMRGGGETRHLAWMRELAAMGVDVDVIAGRPLFGAARHPIEGVPSTVVRSPYVRDAVYRWQTRRGFGRLTMTALRVDEELFCRSAWKVIAGRRPLPDVVHAHALPQAVRLRRGGVPVVVNMPGPPNAKDVADLRGADAVTSDGWAAAHLGALLGRPVDNVPKGVDAELFSPEGPSVRATLGLENRRVVVTVCRLVPLKDLRLLLDAVALARRTASDLQLVIVGEGPERRRLETAAAELRIADAVTFAGYVPHAETPRWYRAADVFALTSAFDNSPNAVLEAMACGLPIVATDVGGLREFVAPPRHGTLVMPGDPTAVAAALVEMLDVPDRMRSIGAVNRACAVEQYSWRASAAQLHGVYQRAIAARGVTRMAG